MTKQHAFCRRKFRNRKKLLHASRNSDRMRLSIFRSGKHIYAQVIDDTKGITLASASSLDKDFPRGKGHNREGAVLLGKKIAENVKKLKITSMIFDRGAYPYKGRVKEVAEAARAEGLNF